MFYITRKNYTKNIMFLHDVLSHQALGPYIKESLISLPHEVFMWSLGLCLLIGNLRLEWSSDP
jgi:hypothetical protein